ncbi:hypothetical protein [Demequina mangrovi]|uniref:Uncharacterized protein n=1 Tax=Demequina mangrovi TaxID=1043493 RepID=A0A1H6XNL4_9MICO|nr:hypothetical protein [Demequina mangrovi]SEJ26145.1 hypothetical protein SAMN05421637_1365 [Demequina mangrovi]
MAWSSPAVAAASLAVRIVPALGAVFVGLAPLEQLETWDDPSAATIPTEHTMPYAANWLLGPVMLAAAIALIAGWAVRLRSRRNGAAAGDGWGIRVWRACAWVTAIAMVPWIAVLAASQWIASRPTDGVIGMGFPGDAGDGLAALAALATLVIVARDLRKARARQHRAEAAVQSAPA